MAVISLVWLRTAFDISFVHLVPLLSNPPSPTATVTSTRAAQTASGLDSTVLVALIGLTGTLIAAGLAFYQFRRNARLERQRQAEQFAHEALRKGSRRTT